MSFRTTGIAILLFSCVCRGAEQDLPPAAQRAIDKYHTQVQSIEAKAQREIAAERQKLFRQLEKDRTGAARDGKLDVASRIDAMIGAISARAEEEDGDGAVKSIDPPTDAAAFEGHHYFVVKDEATWHIAANRCRQNGGHLATIATKAESEFLAELAGKDAVWVGAADDHSEGDWKWIDGTPVPKELTSKADNWAKIQHHLSWIGTERRFDDQCGEKRLYYICEWDR